MSRSTYVLPGEVMTRLAIVLLVAGVALHTIPGAAAGVPLNIGGCHGDDGFVWVCLPRTDVSTGGGVKVVVYPQCLVKKPPSGPDRTICIEHTEAGFGPSEFESIQQEVAAAMAILPDEAPEPGPAAMDGPSVSPLQRSLTGKLAREPPILPVSLPLSTGSMPDIEHLVTPPALPPAGVAGSPPLTEEPVRASQESGPVLARVVVVLARESPGPGVPPLAAPPQAAPFASQPPNASPRPPVGGEVQVASSQASGFFTGWGAGASLEVRVLILGLIATVIFLLPYLVLYRRIRRERLLDSLHRQAAYEFVATNPGTSAAQVAHALGVQYNTARHHLDLLVEFGALSRRTPGGALRYFENHGRYTTEEKQVLASVSRAENVAFLRLVGAMPGITQKEAAGRLGLTQGTVSRRVAILLKASLLSREDRGLRLTPAAARVLTARTGR